MVELLAPTAPACFQARSTWISYLQAAASEQRGEHEPGPLIFSRNGVIADTDAGLRPVDPDLSVRTMLIFKNRRVEFNFSVGYCSECTTTYRSQMLRENRCNPDHLRRMVKESVL
jgi:hypothetical protein